MVLGRNACVEGASKRRPLMTGKRSERSYRVRRANQVHRAIGPTVAYLRALREQLDRNGSDYNDAFYCSVMNAYDELQKLFITSFITTREELLFNEGFSSEHPESFQKSSVTGP
jgi:hypothetical protein